jgi:hypothetical protein
MAAIAGGRGLVGLMRASLGALLLFLAGLEI